MAMLFIREDSHGYDIRQENGSRNNAAGQPREYHRHMSRPRAFVPVLGTRYGTRIIVEDVAEPDPNGKRVVRMRCDCGSEGVVQFTLLRRGRSRTCAACSSAAAGAAGAKRWRLTVNRKAALERAGHKDSQPS